jgi:hypothetical protein
MKLPLFARSTSLLVAATLAATACSKGDDEPPEACEVDTSYQPLVDLAPVFSTPTTIDNPLFPLVPGTVFSFAGGGETIVVEVTSTTRTIAGVACVEVRDTVRVGGVIIEDTLDWYAQDDANNVWYFGEDTKEFEDGLVVSTEGSWEAGVGGAQPGLVMLASPRLADVYRQEYLCGEAEDAAEVVALGEDVTVPFGPLTGCLRTRDYTPLDLGSNEYKWYCPGIGMTAEVNIWNGNRVELVSVTPP